MNSDLRAVSVSTEPPVRGGDPPSKGARAPGVGFAARAAARGAILAAVSLMTSGARAAEESPPAPAAASTTGAGRTPGTSPLAIESLRAALSAESPFLAATPAPDLPFAQESRTFHPIDDPTVAPPAPSDATKDVRAIATDHLGRVWAGARAGIFRLDETFGSDWRAMPSPSDAGPTYDFARAGGRMAAGTWNGLWLETATGMERVEGVEGPISAVAAIPARAPVFAGATGTTTAGAPVPSTGGEIYALGPKGVWLVAASGTATRVPYSGASSVRDAVVDARGRLYIATGHGLFLVGGTADGSPTGAPLPEARVVEVPSDALAIAGDGRAPWLDYAGAAPGVTADAPLIAPYLTSVDLDAAGLLWVTCAGGASRLRLAGDDGAASTIPTPDLFSAHDRSPFPEIEVSCSRLAPDGRRWFGTAGGASVWPEGSLVPRSPEADVSDPRDAARVRRGERWLPDDDVRAIDFDANGTAWIATAGGVAAIRTERITLAEKARRMHAILEARHVRPPGLVEKARLRERGVVESWEPMDDDNDGEYTGMALTMESMRWAVTRDPEARRAADRAWVGLRFLHEVTGTKSFVARTAIPPDWERMADPNKTYDERERADELVADPRYKPVEERWRMSRDGKWRWKGDTSSDEITGHFYGYAFYYDLAADETRRAEVREHVRRLMDGLIEGGFELLDTDGTHTRWGVWAPERLNDDPLWRAERGCNSVELLSFLGVTAHVTGDEKYRKLARELALERGLAENVRRAKTFNPWVRTHIDDELTAMAWPQLIAYERDPALRAIWLEGFRHWAAGMARDRSPFFACTIAPLSGDDPRVEESLGYLRDAPLDLINWGIDNATREDLRVVRRPSAETEQTDRLLPASEREPVRWDGNPWRARQGDGGWTESAPTSWLLGYWMMRWSGLLADGE